MDLRLTDEQEALAHSVGRFLAKASSPEQVRDTEPGGFDPAVWQGLVDMGVPTLGVAEAQGGSGATLADLAVMAHACGGHLASAPVVEVMVANRLLAYLGTDPRPGQVNTLALRPVRDGRATLVPGGAVAASVIALDGDDLVALHQLERRPVANLGHGPLADVDVRSSGERRVLASGDAARGAYGAAVDEWRALTAVWLHGLGRSALDLGVAYAKDRKQFGVAIGSFQAVQHQLADLHTALDGAWLLAQKAVWALDPPDSPNAGGTGADASRLAAMAFAFTGETAEAAAASSLHYHGGYGFMTEYDIQLYFRRAKAARLVLGDPRRELHVVADRLFGPVER